MLWVLHFAFSRPHTQGSPARPGSALGYLLVRPMRGEEAVGRSCATPMKKAAPLGAALG